MSKAKAQTAHALRRAYERYNLRLNEHHLYEIVRSIHEGRATHVVTQSNRVSVFDVPCLRDLEFFEYGHTQMLRVVYDKQRKTIVTFLHPDQGYV